MRKLIPVLLFILFFSGCKSSFKSNFRDFNAYYNTFYNAKKSYSLGLEKSLTQARNYNTLQPLRIYETPLGAGGSDFQNSIEKGASVLRKFDDTKWVDDALEIIGKSYYFRMEYFSADQKFDELYITSSNEEMQQRAVFWKGRVFYEFQAYEQGIQYLTEQLTLFGDTWNGNLEFQVKVILAEHYVAEENWVTALELLNESVPRISGRENKERGFFLIGQINEILGDSEAAFAAYNNVEKHYSVYELQFEAKKKKAELARTLGDSDEAYSVFLSMVRDDKNTEFIAELNYELGRTEQDRGNSEKAERIYISILRDPLSKPTNITKAQVYNGLAEINRFEYDNYTLAAAYYDSSARLNVALDELPESYNAPELAASFGEYANLKNQIHEHDSLLWLGSLSPEAFDSVLTEIENRKREELERLRQLQEEQRNTIVNVSQTEDIETQNTGENGFLNVKNPVLVADAREQFNAIWQGRPLVDNWRVSELMVTTFVNDSTVTDAIAQNNSGAASEVSVVIDLSRIPFEVSEQDSMKNEQLFLYYELGNLFFLSLDLPDSAEHYFNKVLDENIQSEVAPVTMYSLTELFTIQHEEESARTLAEELVELYPGTIYADRLVQKYGIERPNVQIEETENPVQVYLALSSDDNLSALEQAKALSKLSVSNPNDKISERALFESIQNYVELARAEPNFEDTLYTWQRMQTDWEKTQRAFLSKQDSARTFLSDTTLFLSSEDSLMYSELADSTLLKPDFTQYFPYYGEYWDSTRTNIHVFDSLFTDSEYTPRVRKLGAEFKLPVLEEPEPIQEDSTVVTNPDIEIDPSYLSCDDIETTPLIRGGVEAFNATLSLPSNIQETTISFFFFINSRGIIDEFQLLSETENEELINAYVEAIDASVSFEPVLVEGESRAVSCGIEFDIPKN